MYHNNIGKQIYLLMLAVISTTAVLSQMQVKTLAALPPHLRIAYT
ncbi:hypothetical protein SAMN05421788_10938 [Filimonas lacunae]|uniref:Uncharacterized protein n=1 Tax=Filimonas lacunae TaxID=477680 RepID=A0A173MJM1_9BACT|nr:hypothetical protein [Filimonas lacunae]BAV07611.1 hypothetical protein FLA_3637 [Filimonas lacunae]SIT29791.1 hypothetical protein SAMN05421788_10938 [Filimonas lacunae]